MERKMPYDPRIVANLVLKYAGSVRTPLTNLAINKIAYFLHGHFLARIGEPLIDEEFEAWEFGPVSRSIYMAFRRFSGAPIDQLARRMDFTLGAEVALEDTISERDLRIIADYIHIYARASVHQLIEWSHVKGGPWDKAWNYTTLSNPGMIISNQDIANHFRRETDIHGGFNA